MRLSQSKSFSSSIGQKFKDVFRDVFLPHGYPDSVSEDYFNYQVWDTIQAFCSTITGIFTTQAILEGVGVGNPEATPLAAAITWVLKDGTGMLGRIIFAWWKGYIIELAHLSSCVIFPLILQKQFRCRLQKVEIIRRYNQ